MTQTLFSARLDLARIITNVVEGAATSGSTTTLVDTNFPYRMDRANAPIDDFYNRGTLFLKTSTQAGISPACIIVTDWARSSQTITFAALAKTITAGDTYALIDNTYPLYVLTQAINMAIGEIGGVDATNTSLSTIDETISYSLPTGVSNVVKVEVANETSTPYTWTVHNNWRIIGSTLEFDSAPVGGYVIRLTYRSVPTELTTDAGTISDQINPDWLKYTAATYALNWRLSLVDDDEPSVKKNLILALENARKNAAKHRALLNHTPKAHHFNVLGSF